MSAQPIPSTRSDLAAARLHQEILDGVLPPGTLLAESAVAQRLGVSRVPVREAHFALEGEGLVEFSDTGRAFVKDLTPRDFEELFLLRLALEPLAARLAASTLRAAPSRLEANVSATDQRHPRGAHRVGEPECGPHAAGNGGASGSGARRAAAQHRQRRCPTGKLNHERDHERHTHLSGA